MATFKLQYLSNPKVLHSIEPERLRSLLIPFSTYLAGCGFELPPPEKASRIDREHLAEIFANPTGQTPRRLLDAIFLINEMSSPAGLDALCTAAQKEGFELDYTEKRTPADFAAQMWLENPQLLERQHATFMIRRPRRFDCFQGRDGAPDYQAPSSRQLRALERDLNDWFASKLRGRGVRVFFYASEHEDRFLVRHGEPFRREEAIEGDTVESMCYRPLRYDVVIYDKIHDELRVNTRLSAVIGEYCQSFGRHLFGDPDRFPGTDKYSLSPLLDLGEDALATGDVPGIDWIKLVRVHFVLDGPEGEFAIRGARDFFKALEIRGAKFPRNQRMAEACFRIKFEDSRTPRTLRICPGNVAAYMRDGDAVLAEQWMRLRGFIRSDWSEKREAADTDLAFV